MKSTEVQEYEKQSSYECNGDGVVRGALALVLRISKCAGVAPLRFTATEAGWRVEVSPRLAVFYHILMTILNLVAVVALILDCHEEPQRRILVGDTAVTAFVWVTDLVVVNAIASLAVYHGPGRMEMIIRLLNQLQKINIALNNDSCVRAEKIGMTAVMIMLIFVTMIHFTEVSVMTHRFMDKGYNWTIMVMYIPHYVAHTLRLLMLLQWAFVVLKVYRAATTLNQRLLRLNHVRLKDEKAAVLEVCLNPPKIIVDCFTERHNATNHPEFVAYPSQVQSTIRRLASCHGHIGELVRQMNEANGVMIIANLMAIFLHLVVTPYYLLRGLSSDEGLIRAVLLPLCWIVLHTAALLLTVEPCHWTQEQRETTKFLVSRLTVCLAPKSKLLARELDQFAKQIVLFNVKFTPLGVLTLGRPFVASMFGGVATYLVILMQFYELTD